MGGMCQPVMGGGQQHPTQQQPTAGRGRGGGGRGRGRSDRGGGYRGRGRGRGGGRGGDTDTAAAAAAAAAQDAATNDPLLRAASQGPVCCIDVECVATGTTHHDRAIAQIALVALEQEECRSVATPPATT